MKNALKDLVARLGEFEYADGEAEELANLAGTVNEELTERDARISTLEAELNTLKTEADESTARAVLAEQSRDEIAADSQEAAEKLTAYMGSVATQVADARKQLKDIADWRKAVVEREGAIPSSDAEALARAEGEKDQAPLASEEEFAAARSKPNGSLSLFRSVISRAKDRYGDIWDNDFDGDPFRAQTVRTIQANSRMTNRPKFV